MTQFNCYQGAAVASANLLPTGWSGRDGILQGQSACQHATSWCQAFATGGHRISYTFGESNLNLIPKLDSALINQVNAWTSRRYRADPRLSIADPASQVDSAPFELKNSVRISRLPRHLLQHIPMLDDLPVNVWAITCMRCCRFHSWGSARLSLKPIFRQQCVSCRVPESTLVTADGSLRRQSATIGDNR